MFTTVKKASLAEIEKFLSTVESSPVQISRFRDEESIYPVTVDALFLETVDHLDLLSRLKIRNGVILVPHSLAGAYIGHIFNNHPEIKQKVMEGISELIIMDDQ